MITQPDTHEMKWSVMSSPGNLRGTVRWAFNVSLWNPTEQEWSVASRCVQLEEKERIHKFVFKSDAKASMVGRLMMRKLVHLVTGEPYDEICIFKDEDGRPMVKNKTIPIDFNVSHQGDYTVLAGEVGNDVRVGVDVMSLNHRTGHKLSEFFRLMNRTFTRDEWSIILASPSEPKQAAMFFRLWSLKESYLKARGIGIRIDLNRVSFKVNTLSYSLHQPCVDSIVQLDGKVETDWVFHEWLLDPNHCVSVALSSGSGDVTTIKPQPFTQLSWSELVKEAKPLSGPDVKYCKEFMNKEEKAY